MFYERERERDRVYLPYQRNNKYIYTNSNNSRLPEKKTKLSLLATYTMNINNND